MPKWPKSGQYGWCKWCGEAIPLVIDGKRSTQRMWHPACVYQFELHTRLTTQYDFLVERDGECCAWPGCGEKPMRWKADRFPRTITKQNIWNYQPGVPGWWDDFPDRPEGRWQDLTPEERRTGEHVEIERVCALEVDHRVALWSVANLPDDQRRWYFGPGNLWLLCPRHHKEKTKLEAGERAARKAAEMAARVRDKAGQLAFETRIFGPAIAR
jgi:hypothetical protein